MSDPVMPEPTVTTESEDRLLAFADRLRRSSEEDDIQEEQPEVWVSFRLAHRSCALPVTHVREFTPVGQITRVPGAPAAVCGVASLRGHAIPVVDLKKSLGLGESPSRGDDFILVVEQRGRLIGLLVDRVEKVVKLLPSRIKSAPSSNELGLGEKILGSYELESNSLILLAANTFLGEGGDPKP
jgi:chemotaxis signal transduction protein